MSYHPLTHQRGIHEKQEKCCLETSRGSQDARGGCIAYKKDRPAKFVRQKSVGRAGIERPGKEEKDQERRRRSRKKEKATAGDNKKKAR